MRLEDHLQGWATGDWFQPNRKVRLFYRMLIPDKPRCVLILIHGAGQHSGQFLEVGTVCWHQHIAFYAFDLRGFGKSSGKRGHVRSFYDYLRDLHRFIGWIKQIHPGVPVVLLGHSLGGTIVIRYGQEHQHSVNGAILSAPALKIHYRIPKYLRLYVHLLSRFTPGYCFQLSKWSHLASKIPEIQPLFARGLDNLDKLCAHQFSVRWITETVAHSHTAFNRALNFQIPALCLCGVDDRIVNPQAVRDFYHRIPVADKRYVPLYDEGHGLFDGQQKNAVFQHMVDWIQHHFDK
jgi:lysophospholipase